MSETFSGIVKILDEAGNCVIYLDGEGQVFIGGKNFPGEVTFKEFKEGKSVMHFYSSPPKVSIGTKDHSGSLIIRDAGGSEILKLDGGNATIIMGAKDLPGSLVLDGGNATIIMGAKDLPGSLVIKDSSGRETIRLEGDEGDIMLSGADCAEEFDVEGPEKIDCGTVMTIDTNCKLMPSKEPYDRKVAGVISGGNDSNPGIILNKNSAQNKRLPIALNGKVYCKVDATFSPIEVGDLLTTSSNPGYAMKANDPSRAFGSVIGKALCSIKSGQGLIPILVALQ